MAQKQKPEDTPVDKFRKKVLARGAHCIKGIGRTFRIYDDDGSKNLNFEEFSEGVQDYGIDITKEEAKEVFDLFDKDGSGEVSIDEFLIGLRGNMNKSRLAVVDKAWNVADKDGSNVFDMHDLKKVYNVKQHPKFQNGDLTEEQIFHQFLGTFEPDPAKRDGKVTKEEFLNYYAGISAGIDNDAYFSLMVKNAWKC